MSIKFRTMQSQDYKALGPVVNTGFDKDAFKQLSNNLVSPVIFDGPRMSGPNNSAARDHNRAHISLNKPVVNYLLARQHAELLCKVLDIPTKDGSGICNMSLIWSKKEKALIPVGDNLNDDLSLKDVLMGAEIFQMLINQFDIDEAVMGIYRRMMDKIGLGDDGEFFYSKKAKAYDNTIKLPGGWFYEPTVEITAEIPEKLLQILKNEFGNGDARLSYLLNMSSKANLNGMIMEYVAVVPLGMRPEMLKRHDPLSHLYKEIIAANNRIKLIATGNPSLTSYIAAYRDLTEAVNNLIVDQKRHKENWKPIIHKVDSKKGFVRSKMLGRRVDYSGRSVITINPFMSVKNIGLPERMIPKLYQMHLMKTYTSPQISTILGRQNDEKSILRLKSKGVLDTIPVILGRQPTLHKLSCQAYMPQVSTTRSIQLNPLMCPAFNADFDGDQMYVVTPNSDRAVDDVMGLMLTTQNFFLPENGKCVIAPRQEIIYGLYVCSKDYPTNARGGSYMTYEDLLAAIYNQDLHVSTIVTCMGRTDTAGRLAVRSCFAAFPELGDIQPITSKNINDYVTIAMSKEGVKFIECIDKMVSLGFKVGYIYPPTLKLLDVGFDKEQFEKFHESLEETTDWYERGFEEESSYTLNFDIKYAETDNVIKNNIYNKLGDDNGFVQLARCGARGSKGNLAQIYSHKGRVQKSPQESFKAVIEHSYIEQLYSLEHFMTAYGGRKGLIDKSLNTADTGYLTRKLVHTCQAMRIRKRDCGTKNGITITKGFLAQFSDDKNTIDEMFIKSVTGRYLTDGRYVTKELAKELCKSENASITIRSPLTCDDPCCQKCYGDDPSTNRYAAVGLEVGIIAGQSIGKISTQLTMDNFKKGGIAGEADVLSNFKKVKGYMEMRDFRESKGFSSYDPLAWATGKVITVDLPGNKQRVKIEGDVHSINISSNAVLKSYVEEGEGLCTARGDFSPRELVTIKGVEDAQMYIAFMLFSTYFGDNEVSLKHFEILLSSMTMGMVIDTDRDDLKIGQYHDMVQLKSGSLKNTKYVKNILSVDRVQRARPMALSSLLFGYLAEEISKAVLLEESDPLEYPLQRALVGKGTKGGSAVPEYIMNRTI